MGGGKQGERKCGAVEDIHVHSSAKGGFLLTAKGASGDETEVERSEADLVSFHKQVVQSQCSMFRKDLSAVEAELAFPLQESKMLHTLMGMSGLLAFAAAVLKVTGLSMIGVESVALGLAVACLITLGVQRSQRAQVGPIEAYLKRTMQLDGVESMLTALLEKPLRPDWPSRVGSIDLDVHDLPHASSTTEWWYFNSHVTPTGSERPLSVFICFFRILKFVEKKSGKKHYAHALTWAVSDVENKKYYSDVLLDKDSPKLMLKSLEDGDVKDPILKRAFQEILEKGNVPLPDRLFTKDAKVSNSQLSLDYEDGQLWKDSRGLYHLKAKHYKLPCEIDLVFKPTKNPVRHGNEGVVKGKEGDDMFYYCISRCQVSGTIKVPKPHKRGAAQAVHQSDMLQVSGCGWYDHEFGGKPEEEWGSTYSRESDDDEKQAEEGKGHAEKLATRYAWNWVACQLDDNTELTAAVLYNALEGKIMEVKSIVVDQEGNRTQFDETDGVSFVPVESKRTRWTSVRTFKEYPVSYKLVVPKAELDLMVTASFEDQEFVTMLTKPAFWEGRCEVVGTKQGKPINGLAFVERNGFDPEQSIKAFFKAVGKIVRKSVQTMYPLEPTYEEGVELIASESTQHYMKGVPLDVIGKTLIAPVRLIADRGGKSWRSYGALACVDCVGGDSRDFVDWIAMPEFLHVGSLIVDDIQDESETRRGGPAAHHEFGVPLCINAGTAAYFQCEQMLKAPGLTPEELNKCYGLYFSALRGGHAGQALDINGLDYMMDQVVETGDADLLEERILAIHMLKTAVPAGTLARMGALVGKGTEEQVEAMGRYFESVGIAFQIMDDVLNLRGLYSAESDKLKLGTELKQLGEDISCGKVTMPVAKAMGLVKNASEREALWKVIQSKPQDKETVDKVIAQLEELGAIEACVKQAEQVVEEAWCNLDQVIPDSFAKMMLRAFGTFVIERCQ